MSDSNNAKPKTPKARSLQTTTMSKSILSIPAARNRQDQLNPALAADELAQHQQSSFPVQAPLRQVQPPPSIGGNPPGQQQYNLPGSYSQQPALHSPYLGGPSQYHPTPHHQPASEHPYYATQPSPRSSNGGTYYSTDNPDKMAAATMQRPFPPMYHTPQTSSPVSVTSPQTHDPIRPMYSHSQQPGQMQASMYPYTYSPLGHVQTPYGSHSHSSMGTAMMPTQYGTTPMGHQPLASQSAHHNTSPRTKIEPGQPHYAQTPQQHTSLMTQQQTPGATPRSSTVPPPQTPATGSTSSAAPGPIPATTPLVIKQDANGVQWISFEYSRDRVKMEYQIRCDTESVDTNALSEAFKTENCVYPRACVPRDQYKGNRLNYESDCNQVGWALAELNTCLRGKRGLIQRAVDSWRNSNQDPRLRSRRVRRQAKMNNKQRMNAAAPPQTPGSSSTTGLPGHAPMSAPGSRTSAIPSVTPQTHSHHLGRSDGSQSIPDSSLTNYSVHPSNRSSSISMPMSSPNELRHAQTFPAYQPYPTAPSQGPSMAPPLSGSMYQYNRPGVGSTMSSRKRARNDDEDDTQLFGDLPEGKKRKFILVDDTQKNARVRVKVTLDQIDMDEIPDSYRKHNSVFPRAYYPVQMQSGRDGSSTRFTGGDNEDITGDAPPTAGRTTVPCTLSESDSEVEVPQLTLSKRDRERRVNELGYRMAWGQSRVFSNRPIFLGRALDAYRMKQRTALTGAGQDFSTVPAHLEVRPGKRRWLERKQTSTQSEEVPRPYSAT